MPNFPVFMTAAPSMPAGSHEMRDNFSDHDPPRSLPYTAPTVTPYLGLRSRLSQVWLNRWTILLLIVLARVLLAISSINDKLSSARDKALSECTSVEAMGSVMVSIPHYMAAGYNQIVSDRANKAVEVARNASVLAVNGLEDIVFIIIHMLTAYRLCVMEFVAGGSAAVAEDILSNAQSSLSAATKNIGDDIANVADGFVTAYNNVRDKLSGGVIGLGTSIPLPPAINLSSNINQVRNLTLPPDLADKVKQLNQTVFSLVDQAQNFTDTTINSGFDLARAAILKKFDNASFTVDQFPVPEKQKMAFCDTDNPINRFFDHLDGIIATAMKIFITVLLLAAILVCIPMAYREIRGWRKIRDRAEIVGSQKHDPLDVVYIVSRPYTSTAGIKVSSSFNSTRRQILVRWVIAYATSPAALFVLSLALAGLFSCLCNYILIKSVQKEIPDLTSQVTGFADKVADKLDQISADWAGDVNGILTKINTTINDRVDQFDNATENILNVQLPAVFDDVVNTINETFSQSATGQALETFVKCIFDLRTALVRELLGKIQNNTHVFIERVDNDTFSRGALGSLVKDQAADQSFLATAGDAASDKISDVITIVTNKLLDQLRIEAILSACVLAIWVFAVLTAIIRAATLWNGHDKLRGEGGAAPNPSDAHASDTDFRSDDQDQYGNVSSSFTGPVNHPNEPGTPYRGPAPRYSTAIEEKAMQQRTDNPFDDDKRTWPHGRTDQDYNSRF